MLSLAVCSGIFTKKPSLYNDEECVYLLSWSIAFFIYLCVVSGFNLILIIMLMYDEQNSNSDSESRLLNWMTSFYYYFKIIARIAFCIIIVGLAFSYEMHENCGYLKTYNLVILIITLTFLGFYLLWMMCGCVGTLWTSFQSKKETKKPLLEEKSKNLDFLEAELS